MLIAVPFTGGCACGAIRYECSAAPLLVWKCHCRTCQQATGTAFNINVLVLATALKFTKGEPKYYAVKAESGGQLHRGFCSACGSPVGAKSDAFSDIRGVYAGSMDDPSGLERPAGGLFGPTDPEVRETADGRGISNVDGRVGLASLRKWRSEVLACGGKCS